MESGLTPTQHEVKLAVEASEAEGRPHVMLYFNQQPYNPQTVEELDHWKKVLEFRNECKRKGLFGDYNGAADFEKRFAAHLKTYLRSVVEPSPPKSEDRTLVSRDPKEPVFVTQAYAQLVRAAGLAELVGDIELSFTGSPQRMRDGRAVPFDIEVALNVNVTNGERGDSLEDVKLILNDGAVLPGVLTGGNSVLFKSVPIWHKSDETAPRARVVNLRANASQLGVPASSEVPFSKILASVSVTGAHAIETSKRVVTVGVPFQPCVFHVQKVSSATSHSLPGNHVDLVFDELFLNAFKNAFEEQAGPLGTRFLIRFFGVPEGLRLSVSSRDLPSEPNPPKAVLVEEADEVGGRGNLVRAVAGGENNSRFVEVDIDGGYGSVTWEWVGDISRSLGAFQNPRFRLAVEDLRTRTTPATFDVAGSLAPLSTVFNAAEGEPVPRFIDDGGIGGVKRISLRTSGS